MSEPFVDVVIACHDASRPIERAVASVLHDADVRDAVRVTVVAHGIAADPLRERLREMPGQWRVVEFSDGVRSPAGPFNRGLELADATYSAVMGSDDFLEPGALSGWISYARHARPDAAIAPIRIDGEPPMPNPLPRWGRRRHRLDAARDRLFYRSAPLGLIRTETIRRMSLAMTEGVRVGEDIAFGVRLFSQGGRIDYMRGAPCYVIGTDASQRTTHVPLAVRDVFAPVEMLLGSTVPHRLSASHRRALAIKLARVNVLGTVRARSAKGAWVDDGEVRHVSALLRRIFALAPNVAGVFNRADRTVLDGLTEQPTIARVSRDAARTARAGRSSRWFTANPLRSFGRESSLRRYFLYVLSRDFKDARW